MTTDDLHHRELTILRTLHAHLTGVLAEAPCLTAEEYTSAVIALRVKGLCGAEEQAVESPWTHATISYVKRVWLTPEGRKMAGGL